MWWLIFLIIPYMAVTSAWSGGSLKGHDKFPATWMPEALFSLGFIIPWIGIVPWWFLPFIAGWSYIWMQTGHANALPWGSGGHNPNRTNTLQPLVNRLAKWLDIEQYSAAWCWLFFAVKGLLIGLPVGGGILAILWPEGYRWGKKTGKHIYCELLSGAGAGVAIVLFFLLTR